MRASQLLRQWRKDQGINAGTAAERLGITGSALSEYEHGKRKPRIAVALQIAERTGGVVSLASWETAPTPTESGTLPTLGDRDDATGTGD